MKDVPIKDILRAGHLLGWYFNYVYMLQFIPIIPNRIWNDIIIPYLDSNPLLSGYKSNNSIWLKFPASGFLNSLFISSSCKAIFSNG